MKTVARAGMLCLLLVVCGSQGLWAATAPSEEAAQSVVPETPPRPPSDPDKVPAPQPGDQREGKSGVTLGEDIMGRILIRDADDRLVTRLFKAEGRRVLVPLDPGEYQIEWETEPEVFHTAVSLGAGERIVIDRDTLRPGEPEVVAPPRGPVREHLSRHPVRPTYDLRWCRLTLDMGGWASGDGTASVVITDDAIESHNGGFLGGASFGYRLTPEWMIAFGVTSRLIDARDGGWDEKVDRASFLTTLSVGARFYLPPLATRSAAKPYLSAGIGPTFGTEVESREWDWSDDRHRRHDVDTVRSQAVFGGHLGAGIDIQATSWLVLGTDVSYHFASKLDQPVGGRRDPSGFAFAFQVGFNFGRRLPAPIGR